AGLIDTWDAINEAVIMPVFTAEDNGITRLCRELGRIPTVRLAFEEARTTNPSATLLINDFDLSTAYECLIEGVLEAGCADRRHRPAVAHAPGVLGRGEDAPHRRPVRAVRASAAPDRVDTGLRGADAARD